MLRIFAHFLLENLRLVWNRLTLSKVTIAYVAFTVIHTSIQVGLQSEAFVLNNRADSFLKSIVSAAGFPVPHGINVLVKNGPLYLCDSSSNIADCTTVWSPKAANGNVISGSSDSMASVYATSSSYYEGANYYASPTGTADFGAAIVLSSTTTDVAQSTSTASETASGSIITSSPSSSSPPPTASSVALSSESAEAVSKTTKVITVTVFSASTPSQTPPSVPARLLDDDDDEDDDDDDNEKRAMNVFLPSIPPLRRTTPAIEDIPASEDFIIEHDWRARRGIGARSKVRRALKVGTAGFDSNGTLEFVPVSGFSPASLPAAVAAAQSADSDSGVADLPPACVKVLAWPLQNLATSGREDIVFLAFNIWALGMSFMAVLNESMPHMIAAVITHILLTSWTSFQLFATENFRTEFLRITKNGACQGVNLLPAYWEERRNIELAELILNVAALVISVFLSWRLVKQFGWQTFKRVGASLTVNHMYKLVLGLSVALQLSMFFIVASMALWIEQICSGAAQFITEHKLAYQVLYLVIIILLVPWVTCGWFGVRRESKELTLVFLIGAVFVITSWGGMFFSHTFRLLFATWGFFAMLTVIAMLLSGVTLVLGIACRVKFGQNAKVLASYLKPADEESVIEKRDLSDEYGFGYGDKVQFPGGDVPTYESIMRRNGNPASVDRPGQPALPPLTIPADAHTNSYPRASSRSPFFSTSSSPSRPDSYGSESHSGYATSLQTHSRTGSAISDVRSEGTSPKRSNYPTAKKAWVIE